MRGAALLFLPGVVFGVGLAVSGMTDPGKVIGFLDLAGEWDPSLAFVMGGAVLAFTLLNQVVHRRAKPLLEGELPGRRAKGELTPRLFIGAALFGVGWGLGGICPGPALANLGALRLEALVFVPAMLVGMLIAQRVFGADA